MVDGSSAFSVGYRVYAGRSKLGGADSTGNSTGDHLHIVHFDSNFNVAGEYFDFTDTRPTADQLVAGGC